MIERMFVVVNMHFGEVQNYLATKPNGGFVFVFTHLHMDLGLTSLKASLAK